MYITRVYIDGFKRLVNFDLTLNETLSVIVGDNETGKSSVLEALVLVLSRQYDGRAIDYRRAFGRFIRTYSSTSFKTSPAGIWT